MKKGLDGDRPRERRRCSESGMVKARYRHFRQATLRSRNPKAKASRGDVNLALRGRGLSDSRKVTAFCGKKGGTTDAQLSVLLQDVQLRSLFLFGGAVHVLRNGFSVRSVFRGADSSVFRAY